MDRIYVYLIDLPCQVHEMVTPCSDGYTVYINARLSQAGRTEAYCHALWHITNDDFGKNEVEEIEAKAHRRNG